MFKVFGENYYIDLDKIDKEVELKTTSGESQIHLVKYEMIKNMVETILTEDEEVDEKIGLNLGAKDYIKKPFSFQDLKRIVEKHI